MQSHNSLTNPSWNLMLVPSRIVLGLVYYVSSLPLGAATKACCPAEPFNHYASPQWPHYLGVGALPPHRPSLRNCIHNRCLGQYLPVRFWLHSTSDCPFALPALGHLKGICGNPLLVPKITSWDTCITTPFQPSHPLSIDALLSPQRWFKPNLGLWISSHVPLLSNQCSGEHSILTLD